MRKDFHNGNLESRLGVANKVEAACRNGIETCLEGLKSISKQVVEPYISIARNPEKPFYALGDIVKNIAEIPVDAYKIYKGKYHFSFDKKVSRSLALAETLVLLYGAQKGAEFISGFSGNHYLQAGVGGFIGSEGFTALTFFGTYLAYTLAVKLLSKDEKKIVRKVVSALRETSKASLIILPAGMLSFFSADVGIASLAVFLGTNSAVAARIGAVGGFVLYSGTAKVALHASAENGYLKHN